MEEGHESSISAQTDGAGFTARIKGDTIVKDESIFAGVEMGFGQQKVQQGLNRCISIVDEIYTDDGVSL